MMKTKIKDFLFLSNLKITKQILSVYFVCAFLPILFLGLFAAGRASRQLTDQYESFAIQDGSRVRSILFDITTSIYTASETLLGGDDYIHLFADTDPTGRYGQACRQLEASLASLMLHNAAVSSVHLYTDNPSIPDSSHISSMPEGYAGEDWYAAIGDTSWQMWTSLSADNRDFRDPSQLTLIRRIPIATQDHTAYLVIRLDSNYLKNRIGENRYLILISLKDAPILYASDHTWLQKNLPLPEDYVLSAASFCGPVSIDGKSNLSSICSLSAYKTDSQFFIEVIDPDAYGNIRHIVSIYLLILLPAIGTPSLIIWIFSRYLSARITTLKTAMHQASEGDYNILDNFQGNDELQETFQDLKKTVELIHEKDARYYEEQIAKQQLINRQQQMEFKMLSSQINPHFLYNTLETIRMQALTSHNRDIARSIKLLGKSMHYVLENTTTEFTTLGRELDYIRTYLAIQQLRFGDRIRFTITLQETAPPLTEFPIFPLLLQPIVENAFIHGLKDVEQDGLIRICAEKQDDFLLLTVQDNGIGMEEETLKHLLAEIHHTDASSNSIGLHNIYQRILLCYREDAALTIESTFREGCVVTLKLPWYTETPYDTDEN